MVKYHPSTALLYRLDQSSNIASIETVLAGFGKTTHSPAQQSLTTLKDSIDWRLYRAGYVVEEVQQDNKTCTNLRHIHSDQVQACFPGTVPAEDHNHPHALPHLWHQRLNPLLNQRQLLPILQRQSRTETISLLNSDDKTVLRIRIEQHIVTDPQLNTTRQVGRFLRICPLRGYEKQAVRVQKQLNKTLDLKIPEQQSLFELCLKAIGRDVVFQNAHTDFKVHANTTVWTAIRHLLLDQIEVMQANEASILADSDIESLHDFRVALRRTRTGLSRFKTSMHADDYRHFHAEFAWLGDITSPVRDLDVYLCNLSKYQHMLTSNEQSELKIVSNFLKQKRHQALSNMVWQLQTPRYRRLKQRWLTCLKHKNPRCKNIKKAEQPILKLASDQLESLFKSILRKGSVIDAYSPPKQLHNMRILCKNLRYMIDFFHALYPKKHTDKTRSRLKHLQDNLGEIQDSAVELNMLKQLKLEMHNAGLPNNASDAALDHLQRLLSERQSTARAAYTACFKHFSASEGKHDCMRMLRRSRP